MQSSTLTEQQRSSQKHPGIISNGDLYVDQPQHEEWSAQLQIGPLGGEHGVLCCPTCRAWLFPGEKAKCCVPLPGSTHRAAFLPPEVLLKDDRHTTLQLCGAVSAVYHGCAEPEVENDEADEADHKFFFPCTKGY